jgi:hypothetical protein
VIEMAFKKLGGATAWDTMVEISKDGWNSNDNVVIAVANVGHAADKHFSQTYEYDSTRTDHKDFTWSLPLYIHCADQSGFEARNTGNDTTAITQLQGRLIDLGFGWPAINFGWDHYYKSDTWRTGDASSGTHSVDLPDAVFTSDWMGSYPPLNDGTVISRWGGNWYMLLRFRPDNNNTIGGGSYNYYSQYEADLQKRLDDYPGGLKDFNMGGRFGQYDGRYGSGPRAGVAMFNSMCGEGDDYYGEDHNWGRYVGEVTRKNLEMGFSKTGVYDIATKLAVWMFQQNQIDNGNKFGIGAANGVVDWETMQALEYDVTVPIKVQATRDITIDEPDIEEGSSDLLCAIPLAGHLDCPLFGTPPEGLPDAIKNEIRRLGVKTAYLVGGPAISAGKSTLQGMGISVVEVTGPSAADTSAAVASRLDADTCIVINPLDIYSSYGIGAYAAMNGYPILIVNDKSVSSSIQTELNKRSKTIVIGTEVFVSKDIFDKFKNPKRYSSPDRHRWSVEFNKAVDMPHDDGVYMTTDSGNAHMDAYCSSVLAGKRKSPLIQYHQNLYLPFTTGHYMIQRKILKATLIGLRSDPSLENIILDVLDQDFDDTMDEVYLQPYLPRT